MIGVAILGVACSSSKSSSTSSDNPHGLPVVGDPCPANWPNLAIQCTAQPTAIIQCQNGKWAAYPQTCPHDETCGEGVPGDIYAVYCTKDQSGHVLIYSQPGYPCTSDSEGFLGCTFDGRTMIRCTNGAWKAQLTCSGTTECAFVGTNTVGCT